MPRRKSMSSIDAEISALKDKISATKTRYENLEDVRFFVSRR